MSKFHFGALSWSLPLSSFCNLSLLLEVFQTFNIHSLKNIQWCVSEFGDNLGEGWQDELICWEQSRACWIFKTRLASIESKLAGKYLSVHELKWLFVSTAGHSKDHRCYFLYATLWALVERKLSPAILSYCKSACRRGDQALGCKPSTLSDGLSFSTTDSSQSLCICWSRHVYFT